MFLSLLTFFIITSCKNVENTKLISKDKMVSILLEMHLKEESIMLLKLPNDTSDVFFSEICLHTRDHRPLQAWLWVSHNHTKRFILAAR